MDAALRGEPVDFASISNVADVGPSCSSCGYCHKKSSSFTYGLWAFTLSCQDYQTMIDRGWRRSGKYLYKPNLAASCCPQYTIRLNVSKFVLTKSYKQVVSKFNRFVSFDGGGQSEKQIRDEKHDAAVTNATSTRHKGKEKGPVTVKDANRKGSGKIRTGISHSQHQSVSIPAEVSRAAEGVPETIRQVVELVHAVDDRADASFSHRFRTVLVPSSYDEETFNLYCKYQMAVHGDPASKLTKQNFSSFLVNSPLLFVPPKSPSSPVSIDATTPSIGLGSFHQRYYLDDKLIACAVLDILPKCVSSVYFFYDPDLSSLALGKYSALREIALAAELGRYHTGLKYYYMGYYIHTCSKMKYKAVNNRPSDLLDPETYEWVPFSECEPLLNDRNGGFVSFQKELRQSAAQSSTASSKAVPMDAKVSSKEKSIAGSKKTTETAVVSTKSILSTDSSDVAEGQGLDQHGKVDSDGEDISDEEDEDEPDQSLQEMDPMPGTLHPDSVTRKDLAEVFVVDGDSVVQSVACKRLMQSPTSYHKLQRYVAIVGKELARRMLVEFQ